MATAPITPAGSPLQGNWSGGVGMGMISSEDGGVVYEGEWRGGMPYKGTGAWRDTDDKVYEVRRPLAAASGCCKHLSSVSKIPRLIGDIDRYLASVAHRLSLSSACLTAAVGRAANISPP